MAEMLAAANAAYTDFLADLKENGKVQDVDSLLYLAFLEGWTARGDYDQS